MRPIAVFWACLTSAAFAFLIGAVLGAVSATNQVSQAESQHQPPPVGDQFDEGPVLVRIPGTNTTTTRFIF
ncbi:hypothetical protein [Pseudomonas sp. NUPR-001]|uniref:hypothetical protein n=1 Tax=Pseudomonas sp. NUPR-001 TaxID=3416058 RepID=UPI003F94D607